MMIQKDVTLPSINIQNSLLCTNVKDRVEVRLLICAQSLFVQNLCALHVCISNSGRKPGVDICMCVLDPDTHFIMWN